MQVHPTTNDKKRSQHISHTFSGALCPPESETKAAKKRRDAAPKLAHIEGYAKAYLKDSSEEGVVCRSVDAST